MQLRRSEYLAIGAALAAVAFLGWMLIPTGHAQVKPGVSVKDRQAASAALLEGRWRAASAEDTDQPGAAERLRNEIVSTIADPDHALTQEQRRLFSDTIARELMARAARDPAEYFSATESTPGLRWINEHDADQWVLVDIWYKNHHGGAAPRDDPRGALARIVAAQLVTEKNRVVRFGLGEGGMFLCAYRVRSEEQINDRFAEFLNKKESQYWFDAPATGALRLRVPIRSFDAVLREENQAIVCASLIALEAEGGWTYAWYCYWYWESASNSWQCYEMAKKGVLSGTLFY